MASIEDVFLMAEESVRPGGGPLLVMLSARGRLFTHRDDVRFAVGQQLTLLCGHYKDVDQRVADGLGAEELSVGDFVLSGGEPAALCVLDAVVRLLPGALGDHESAATDSHYAGLLSPPSYTRAPSYRGMDVPAGVLGGDHEKIAAWRGGGSPRPGRVPGAGPGGRDEGVGCGAGDAGTRGLEERGRAAPAEGTKRGGEAPPPRHWGERAREGGGGAGAGAWGRVQTKRAVLPGGSRWGRGRWFPRHSARRSAAC